MNNRNKKVYQFGSFKLDSAEHTLSLDDETVALTPKVFDTLLILIENNGHLVEKDELLERVWEDTIVEEGNLAKNISILRKTLSTGGLGDSFIETVPKRGYRFTAPVKEIKRNSSEKAETADQSKPPTFSKTQIGIVIAVLFISLFGFSHWYFSNNEKPIESIAVLPFENGSGDESLVYLSGGLSESLIDSLSQIHQLRVIARNSSFNFRGKNIDTQNVANELGVQVIVTGKVTQRGEDLIIRVDMADASNKQIWGQTYNKKATDIVIVQKEIFQTLSDKLNVSLTDKQKKQIAKRESISPDAYKNYLIGIELLKKEVGKGSFDESIKYFKKAIELDPNYAEAQVRLADAYYFSGQLHYISYREAFRLQKQSIEKALELDDSLAEAHAGLGTIKMEEGSFVRAEQEFKKAIELNPNLSITYRYYAYLLSILGRHDEALVAIRKNQILDPLYITWSPHEGILLFNARRYDEAIRHLKNLEKINPDQKGMVLFLRYSYAEKGMYEEALKYHRKSLKITGEDSTDWAFEGYVYAKWGKRDKALAILEKIKKTKDDYRDGNLAMLYASLGDKDKALEYLERSYKKGRGNGLGIDPSVDNLRDDPRFQDLLKRIGLLQ